MSYESVDVLQKTLAESVFSYASDAKKAAGRALGTLVEIITYYTLRAWDLRDHIAIERPLAEFANNDIRHNVEFSLHPIAWKEVVPIQQIRRPLKALRAYFAEHEAKIESWFNVISPKKGSVGDLKAAINCLRFKNWKEVLK